MSFIDLSKNIFYDYFSNNSCASTALSDCSEGTDDSDNTCDRCDSDDSNNSDDSDHGNYSDHNDTNSIGDLSYETCSSDSCFFNDAVIVEKTISEKRNELIVYIQNKNMIFDNDDIDKIIDLNVLKNENFINLCYERYTSIEVDTDLSLSYDDRCALAFFKGIEMQIIREQWGY